MVVVLQVLVISFKRRHYTVSLLTLDGPTEDLLFTRILTVLVNLLGLRLTTGSVRVRTTGVLLEV